MIYQYNVLKARIDRLDNLISNLEKFNLESNKNTEEIKIKEFTKDTLLMPTKDNMNLITSRIFNSDKDDIKIYNEKNKESNT